MTLAEFKTHTLKFRRKLDSPSVALETFRDTLAFLQTSQSYAEDVDYVDLRTAFATTLRRVVNPYRHRRILEKYRDPTQLAEIRPWLELWVDSLSTLGGSGMDVPEWHATYDIALYRVLSAMLRQRRSQIGLAAEGWTEAATICREWLNQHDAARLSSGYKKLEADYHFFEGRAYRSRAEQALDRRPSTPDAFDEIPSIFSTALTHMRESGALMESLGLGAAPQEIAQLEYLTTLCQYRAAVLKQDFPAARSCLDRLSTLVPATSMKHLPYFGESEDLNLEKFFLQTFESLAAGDIPGAMCSAEQMLPRKRHGIREPIRREWRRLRVFAIQLLAGNPNALQDLDSLCRSGFGFGQASRFIQVVCHRFAEGQISQVDAQQQLLSVFPLDAYPSHLDHKFTPGVTSLDWLPPLYMEWLDELSSSDADVARLLYLEWQYVANIAEYLCGLYKLKCARGEIASTPVTIPLDFRLLGFDELREVLASVGAAIEWNGRNLPELIDWLENLSCDSQVEDIDKLASRFQKCIADTGASLFPHIVKVKGQTRLSDGKISIALERVWRLPPRNVELVCYGAKGVRDGEHYFLKATFKRKLRERYDEELQEIFNFHQASSFGLLSSAKICLLVEGDHDVYVFGRLLDAFLPY